MLIKNLSLALGFVAATASGTVVTVHQHLDIKVKAEVPELACKINDPRYFYSADTFDGLMRDIYIVNDIIPRRYHISSAQHRDNIESLIKYTQTSAAAISAREGRVLIDHQDKNTGSFEPSKTFPPFINDTDHEAK